MESSDPSLTSSMTSSTLSTQSSDSSCSGGTSSQQQQKREPDDNQKQTIRTMFLEMFKGRVESAVIDMVLQEENWNGKKLIIQKPRGLCLSEAYICLEIKFIG